MADRTSLPPELDTLAAEYAFGLLEGDERIEAEHLASSDADFAAAVREWEARAVELSATVPAGPGHADLWSRIESGLRPQAMPRPANDDAPARSSGAGWKFATLAASLAALIFAGLWQFDERPIETDSTPVAQNQTPANDLSRVLSVAQISGPDSEILLTGLYNRDTGTLTLRLPDLPDEQFVPEVWVIGEGEAPRSLGFARRGGTVELQLSSELRRRMVEGSSIAVSLEEPSPQVHDAPTPERILGATPLIPLEEGSGPTI